MGKQNDLHVKDWKRDLVLLAKNTHVWLHQLSLKYHMAITSIGQIPEKELSEIASRGINALWLVGLWERSPASAKIKKLYGRENAVASAYSIYQYSPAADLGGESALSIFQNKAAAQGILLACDMVPNHTGLDSPWLFGHPDWYISTKRNPLDIFSYNSPDLSNNASAGIFLEEGYYTQTGAAEVFKFQPKPNGECRYVYHGNDGTSMPWNDTAQLNYLNPDTRRAVMEEILSVARKFKIIRLDAAMTLVREHFKRLWFPSSGAKKFIPTRGKNTLTDKEFDRLMPEEFWREVIMRIKQEAPDTLLVAEAFWLMEKYFINEIGMHRVYNSAFMHHLRDEKNKEFRDYLKEILRTNPLMLERFANFLTTPDEETALVQFGRSDKYFGACKLLACMPGLPLIGHGQWEGLEEKYGMDISHPMMAEGPDQNLIQEHDRIIAPLLRARERFSFADNFMLYDFLQSDGAINENVITFSCQTEIARSLVVFNNSKSPAKGRIRSSVSQIQPSSPKKAAKVDIIQGLNLQLLESGYLLLREMISGEVTKFTSESLKSGGMPFDLKPYESHVYSLEQS